MTGPKQRRTDPHRPLGVLLFRLALGRSLTVPLEQGRLTLALTGLTSRTDIRRLALGQLTDLRISARDIRWEGASLQRARIVARNVRLRPGVPPIVVAAPVEVSLELHAADIDELVRRSAPRLLGDVDADGVARLRWARRPALGALLISTELDETGMRLRPHTIEWGGHRRWRLPTRTPAYRLRLRNMPEDLRLTDVTFGRNTVYVSAVLARWQVDTSAIWAR